MADGSDLPADPSRGRASTPPEIRDLPRTLGALTFDQLRTLVSLYATRSPARTAADLKRQQSSVQKQLRTLNDYFKELCGEPLAHSAARQTLTFYPTGEEFAALSHQLLADWSSRLKKRRRDAGSSLVIGATSFILDFVPETWARVVRRLHEERVDYEVVQIRTHEVFSALRDDRVDITLGGVVVDPAAKEIDEPDIDFLPWHKERFVLLTNYGEDQVRGPTITARELQELELLAPQTGIVHDFLGRWYGRNYEHQLKISRVSGDVMFFLSLLRSGSMLGCVIVPEYLLKLGLPQTQGLRTLTLEGSKEQPDLQAVAGLFVRKADRDALPPDHPIKLVWALISSERPGIGTSASPPRGETR